MQSLHRRFFGQAAMCGDSAARTTDYIGAEMAAETQGNCDCSTRTRQLEQEGKENCGAF